METKIMVENIRENCEMMINVPDSSISDKGVKAIEDWFNELMCDNITMTIMK
jgi:hypothetical protein